MYGILKGSNSKNNIIKNMEKNEKQNRIEDIGCVWQKGKGIQFLLK